MEDKMAESMETYLHSVVQQHKDWLACTRQLYQEADGVLETFRTTVLESHHDGDIDPFGFPSDKEKEQIERILKNKAAIIVTGRTNSGKSSILNTIFRTQILPVSEHPCTARIVRLKYSTRQYQRLLSRHGTEVEIADVHTIKDIRTSEFIKMGDDARMNKELAAMVVEVGLDHELLQSGIEVLDSPGKSENPILDEVVNDLLVSGQIPLVVYVIDGHCGLLLQVRIFRAVFNFLVRRGGGKRPRSIMDYMKNR
jgi:ribosome biogenesis GTPase A